MIDYECRRVSVQRAIAAPPRAVFEVLADPVAHTRIDGSGSLRGAVRGPSRLSPGAVFSTPMRRWPGSRHPARLFQAAVAILVGGRMRNTVVGYEQDRSIAWRNFGRHVWRYELVPSPDGAHTQVTETFDWSTNPLPGAIEAAGFPAANEAAMTRTLDRLAALVEAPPRPPRTASSTPTRQVIRGELAFNVTEAGPAGGEPVLLLHGFPQHADSWDKLVPLLTAQGYRTIAPDQRGYSPGARPAGRRAYTLTELVPDALAVLDAAAPGQRAHVVGHDWGAAVAWALAAEAPERLRSITALSVPHPGAFFGAMAHGRQALRSWYMLFFQLPLVPEFALRRLLPEMLRRVGATPEQVERDAAAFTGPGALTGALNWYRALPLADPRGVRSPARVPTLFIWSDGDTAIDRGGAERCGEFVDAPYQFETLSGVSHWIPDQAPAETAALLLPHLKRWS